MPPPDLSTLENRFNLIQQVYSRLGSTAPNRGKVEKLKAKVKGLLRTAQQETPLPKGMFYSALKQDGRCRLKPRAFMTDTVRQNLTIGLKYEIADAKKIAKDAALPLTIEPIEHLTRAIETGDLNDWLRFYEAFERAGLKSDLPTGKAPALSFWSGESAKGVKASDMAKGYSDSGAGARDIDQVAFKAIKTAAGAAGPLKQSDQAAYDHVWYELFGLQSSLYATLARGDVICFMPRGLSIGNIFWKNELPILRRLQTQGLVGNIYVYVHDEPPAGHDDPGKSPAERRKLWFDRAVALTSPNVALSKRMPDGSWVKLGINADFFVKWLSGHRNNRRSYLVLYNYRLMTNIWAKLCAGDQQGTYVVELRRPGDDDNVRKIEIVGYHEDKEVFGKISAFEKYLMANHSDWATLPADPKTLRYCLDAIFEATGKQSRLLAIKNEGSWMYADAIRPRLQASLGMSGAQAAIDGTPTEDSETLAARVAKIREILKLPPATGGVKPSASKVKDLIAQWEKLSKPN